MSNLNTFVDKVKSVIDTNTELKNSVILNKVLESVRYTGNDIQFLTDLKESLTDVNKFLLNAELSNVISSIDMKLTESNNTDLAILENMSKEFDAVSILTSVANSDEYKNPSLHSVVNSLLEGAKNTKYTYLAINQIIESLSAYTEYNCVNSAIDKCTKYLNENKSKLVVLDAANYLSVSDLNKQALSVLTESLRTNNFNPDSLSMKLGSAASGICSGVLESLRQIRQEEHKGFDMGIGSSKVNIYEYIGPVLVEGADVTFNVNGKFVHISPNMTPDEGVLKIIEGKSNIKVVELKPEYVNSMNTRYFNTQKAFESLGFRLGKNESVAKLNRSSVGFKLNESLNVDVVYNGTPTSLEEIKRDGTQMFESNIVKGTLYGLLENCDMIAHMNFVKFIVNESSASMVINLGDSYYVYDYIKEGTVDTYKFDAYKLYEFCLNKFDYDMSSTFGFAVHDARSKYNKISEEKQKVIASLDDLNTSVVKIDEALKGTLEKSDADMLTMLKKSFISKIDEMNNLYQTLCKDEDILLSIKSCLVKEELTQDDGGNEQENGGEESTQPDENTTAQQDSAEQEGGSQEGGESVQESVINEELNRQVEPQKGVTKVVITFEDGTTSTETVDSELPEDTITKIYAPGAQLNGKVISKSEVCKSDGCNSEQNGEVVEEVNEKKLVIPEWAVSALIENDFRGLTADKYNEALQYRCFLADSGVVSLTVDESAQTEILDKNSMNEERQECVYLKYQINEGFFKKDIYGVESPFAGIMNLGLFKDGAMKKACNQFLEDCAPSIVNKCKFAIVQGLIKLNTGGEESLDDAGKQILEAYKNYDENSIGEEIKNIDTLLEQKKTELTTLKDKLISEKKSLAPAFNYDVAITMSKLFEIKGKILEAFREGKSIDGVEDMDKFKASKQVAELTQKSIEEAKQQSDTLSKEAESLKSAAEQVSKGAENSNSEQAVEKTKAFDVEGKEAEIELTSGIKFRNEIEGNEFKGTDFELGEKSQDGTKFNVKKDGKDTGEITVSELKERVESGDYKVVTLPKTTEQTEQTEQTQQTQTQAVK